MLLDANTSVTPRAAESKPARKEGLDEQTRKIQGLVEQIETYPDPKARALLRETLEAVLHLHATGLERILDIFDQSGLPFDKLVKDDVINGLLLVHGLHPESLELRIGRALEKVRPYMESHGGNVELAGLKNNVAWLRLQGHCKSCPSSAVTMELAIKQAIEEMCPDLSGLEMEGVPSAGSQLHLPNGGPAWHVLGAREDVVQKDLNVVEVDAVAVLICRAGSQLYAYHNECPVCGVALDSANLENAILQCAGGHRFDVRRAGAGLDESGRHLDPFPLITTDGVVKVAVKKGL